MVLRDGYAISWMIGVHLMENLIWKRLDLGRSACGVTCRPRGRIANAFLCFGTVSPDSVFRLHVSPHLAYALDLERVLCRLLSRWRCERVVVCY